MTITNEWFPFLSPQGKMQSIANKVSENGKSRRITSETGKRMKKSSENHVEMERVRHAVCGRLYYTGNFYKWIPPLFVPERSYSLCVFAPVKLYN